MNAVAVAVGRSETIPYSHNHVPVAIRLPLAVAVQTLSCKARNNKPWPLPFQHKHSSANKTAQQPHANVSIYPHSAIFGHARLTTIRVYVYDTCQTRSLPVYLPVLCVLDLGGADPAPTKTASRPPGPSPAPVWGLRLLRGPHTPKLNIGNTQREVCQALPVSHS